MQKWAWASWTLLAVVSFELSENVVMKMIKKCSYHCIIQVEQNRYCSVTPLACAMQLQIYDILFCLLCINFIKWCFTHVKLWFKTNKLGFIRSDEYYKRSHKMYYKCLKITFYNWSYANAIWKFTILSMFHCVFMLNWSSCRSIVFFYSIR